MPFFKVGDFSAAGNERYLSTCANWVSRATASSLGAAPVPPGSVLLPKIGMALLRNARRITTVPTVFDNNVLAVVPRAIETRYLYYWLATLDLAELANPGPVPSLDDSALLDQTIPCSDPQDQRAIADYLDGETAHIDALIEKKRRMVELLEERQMSVVVEGISGRLTEGSSAPSGLPWLPTDSGTAPAVKLTLLARLGSGHTPSRRRPEWWANPTIPWVTTGEVSQFRSDRIEFVYETREKVSELGIANSAAQIHPAGTVVLCRTASAGYSAILGTAMATSQDFATWTCGPRLVPRFLLLCLRAMRQDLLGRLAMGSTHKTIYMPDIEGLRVPLLPRKEQDAIVDAVWTRLGAMGDAIDALSRQLDLLRERRQALITAAVTGEVPIPGVAA